MGVSENGGTPKSSILIGFSIINHPFWGTLIFGNTHISAHLIIQALTGLIEPTDSLGMQGMSDIFTSRPRAIVAPPQPEEGIFRLRVG